MHENTYRRVTFLTNLMSSRLDKFHGSIFQGTYIRDVNWVTHLGNAYSGGLYTGRGGGGECLLTGFYDIHHQSHTDLL